MGKDIRYLFSARQLASNIFRSTWHLLFSILPPPPPLLPLLLIPSLFLFRYTRPSSSARVLGIKEQKKPVLLVSDKSEARMMVASCASA